jgi:hypothetical protein
MKVPYKQAPDWFIRGRFDPKSCTEESNLLGEALTGAQVGQVLSRERQGSERRRVTRYGRPHEVRSC